MELSYISRNGAFFPYISVMLEEVTFQVQIKLKNPQPKKILILQKMELSSSKKNLFQISGPKKLNKTHLEENWCLSNYYTLLVPQASSFLVYLPFPNTVNETTLDTLKKVIIKKYIFKIALTKKEFSELLPQKLHFKNCFL